MNNLEGPPGPLGRLERWAVRCFERHFSMTLLACILAQSAIAMALAQRPIPLKSAASMESIYNDVLLYYQYSDRAFSGEVPYRDFTVEYPPLGLLAVMPPRLVASSFDRYKIAFNLEVLAFNAATLVLAARWTASRQGMARVPRCVAWYTAFFLLSLPTAMARYDVAVMFVTFASACLLLSGRPVAGGAMTAAAVMMKIFPGAAAAPTFYRELTRLREARPRAILSALVAFAAMAGAWSFVGLDGIARMFRYHSERGLEIGSIYAQSMVLAGKIGGYRVEMVSSHFTRHFETPLAMRLASLAIWVQLAAMVLAVVAHARSGMRDGLRTSAACLMAFIAFGKVLSPQYLIWLIPFIACLEGRAGGRARLAFLIVCGLTLLSYPLLFAWVWLMETRGVVLTSVRNLALVAVYGLLVFDRQAPAESAATPPAPEERRRDVE